MWPKKIIVRLSSTTFFEKGRAGGFFFFLRFFFKSKSKLHGIIASISLNKGVNKSTKKYLYTSLNPVLKCKQVESNNLKSIFKRSKFSKEKKKTFFGILKIRGGILLYSKNFFHFSKIRGGQWRTTKQLFFRPYMSRSATLCQKCHNFLFRFFDILWSATHCATICQGCKFSSNCINSGFHEAQIPALLFIFSPFLEAFSLDSRMFSGFFHSGQLTSLIWGSRICSNIMIISVLMFESLCHSLILQLPYQKWWFGN